MIILKFALFIFIAFFIAIFLIIYSFWKQLHRTACRFRPEDKQKQTEVDGNTIIDKRTEKEQSQQIIADDEGEYVDYKES